MSKLDFEELEQHVQTLAFQINILRKNNPTGKQDGSLKVLEEDYQQYRKLYDKVVKKMPKPIKKEEDFGDW